MSAKSKRILALLNNPRHRNRLVGDMNLVDQDMPARVGGDKEAKSLAEMNSFGDDHEKFMDSLKGAD
jgi:hypothetical protein